MKEIIFKDNFPVDGEAYLVGQKNEKFFFAWGSEYPYSDELPIDDVTDGESGIEWFKTEEEAIQAYLEAVESVYDTFGNPIEEVMTSKEAEVRWNMSNGAVRQSILRGLLKKHIEDGHVRKSAGTWLVTKKIMHEVYGDPNEK